MDRGWNGNHFPMRKGSSDLTKMDLEGGYGNGVSEKSGELSVCKDAVWIGMCLSGFASIGNRSGTRDN